MALNHLLLSEGSQLVERDEPKCISTKDGEKEYNTACMSQGNILLS